jgi:DNA-binding MarR family transcriptional regulator
MSNSPLLEAYRALKREITLIVAADLKRLNIGEKQMAILFYLSEGKAMTASSLAFHTQSDPAAVTRAVQSMEEAGLVRRKMDETDNRCTLLELTTKGKDKAASVEGIRNEVVRRIDGTLPPKQLKEFEHLMRAVADGLLSQREKK